MKKKIFILLLLLSNYFSFGQKFKNSSSNFCEGLATYRDNELFQDLEKISRDYELNYEQKKYIENIKMDLLDENKWQMSNAGNAFAQLLVTLKGTCSLLLKTLPSSKAGKASLETYKIYKLYKYGNEAKEFVSKNFEQYIFDKGIKKMLGELNPIKTVIDQTIATASEAQQIDKNWKDYKKTITNQILQLDNYIKQYDKKIEINSVDFETKNEAKNLIDDYLSQNCSSLKEDGNSDVYTSVDTPAEFPGGLNTFRQKAANNLSDFYYDGYGILKTEVTFIIDKDGSITNIKSTGNNAQLNSAAINAVSLVQDKWIPAKVKNEVVPYMYRLPFTLDFGSPPPPKQPSK